MRPVSTTPRRTSIASTRYVYISDECGPYVYEFDRLTGERTRVFSLPAKFAVSKLSAVGN